MLSPDAPSTNRLADECGIPKSTLYRWKMEAIAAGWVRAREEPTVARRPADCSAEEKLRVIAASLGLADEDLGAFLRKEGLHEAQLEQWRREALGGLSATAPSKSLKPSRQIRALERELARKEKALAEAAALLLLKKRAHLLLGGADDDTE